MATISGPPECCSRARKMVQDIVSEVHVRLSTAVIYAHIHVYMFVAMLCLSLLSNDLHAQYMLSVFL